MSTTYGKEKMWEINKASLDQGIAKGKTFLFTSNPEKLSLESDSYKEFSHLVKNGYTFVLDGGLYRGIKK